MLMNECVKIVHMFLCFVGISGDMSTFHFESAYVRSCDLLSSLETPLPLYFDHTLLFLQKAQDL